MGRKHMNGGRKRDNSRKGGGNGQTKVSSNYPKVINELPLEAKKFVAKEFGGKNVSIQSVTAQDIARKLSNSPHISWFGGCSSKSHNKLIIAGRGQSGSQMDASDFIMHARRLRHEITV